jgi:hypothetical protein
LIHGAISHAGGVHDIEVASWAEFREPLPLELSKIQKTFDLEMFWCILIGHAETGDSVGNARRGRAHGSLR